MEQSDVLAQIAVALAKAKITPELIAQIINETLLAMNEKN